MKAKTKGPEFWYAGYGALIWYSLKYGGNQIRDFKELDDRRRELDADLEKITYTKSAMQYISDHIQKLTLNPDIEPRIKDELLDLLGQLDAKVQNRLNVVALDLEFVDAACEEWKKRKLELEGKPQWQAIADQSA
jgi:alkyl hydroperoxide reductase subunit AhpF